MRQKLIEKEYELKHGLLLLLALSDSKVRLCGSDRKRFSYFELKFLLRSYLSQQLRKEALSTLFLCKGFEMLVEALICHW